MTFPDEDEDEIQEEPVRSGELPEEDDEEDE
jgi:hypothetical protein